MSLIEYRFVIQCATKELLTTELKYVRKLRTLITKFVEPLRTEAAEAAAYTFEHTGQLFCHFAGHCITDQPVTSAAVILLAGLEVIYKVALSFLCEMALEIGNIALPSQFHSTESLLHSARYQGIGRRGADQCLECPHHRRLALVKWFTIMWVWCCCHSKNIAAPEDFRVIYLEADMAILLLEILEFCSEDPQSLMKVRRTVLYCTVLYCCRYHCCASQSIYARHMHDYNGDPLFVSARFMTGMDCI